MNKIKTKLSIIILAILIVYGSYVFYQKPTDIVLADIIETSQTITGSWENVGDKFSVNGRQVITIYSEATQNDSENIRYRLLIDTQDVTAFPLPFERRDKNGNQVMAETKIQKNFPKQMLYFNIPENTTDAQLQAMADVVGVTAGILDSVVQEGNYNTEIGTQDIETQDVAIQDQTTPIIDLYFTQVQATSSPTSNVAIDDMTIDVITTINFVAGDIANVIQNDRFYQGEVLSVAIDDPNDTLTLDTPFDYAFTTTSTIEKASKDLAVNGSVTPEIFSIKAPVEIQWDIIRVILNITDATAMDSSRFGGLDALTNGIILRKKNSTYNNIFNAKTNGQIAIRMYDIFYDNKAPAGVFGMRGRRTFNGLDKNGVVVRLIGEDEDEIQIIIQDNLTDLSSFELIGQGHVCDE